jgi:predicted ATPase
MIKPVTDSLQLTRLKLQGYKSIQSCDLELRSLNVLIGANGAGKSNFIGFFRLIQQLIDGNLQRYVSRQGGPDALLHFGRKTTGQLHAELYFGNNGYLLTLEPTVDNRLMFADESFWWNMTGPRSIGSGHFESAYRKGTGTGIDQYVIPAVKDWRVYHFHDTGEDARVKQRHLVNDNAYLWPDARNLAAYLYLLQKQASEHYQRIVRTVRLVAPFFGDFRLRPCPDNKDFIELEWVESGQDSLFKAHMLSDGTLRFICLATMLLQPAGYRPATIIVDEPELGLHPYAITVLASLFKSAAQENQIIVSTQSVELVNEFDSEDLVVVDRTHGRSTFHRPDAYALVDWLSEYSLGELWKKNLLGGRPAR